MNDSCIGLLIGFVSGVFSSALAAYLLELRARGRLHDQAEQLAGVWIAHDMKDGRTVDRSKPMKGSWPTVMTPKASRWGADSHILDISGDEISGEHLRPHDGYLVIDRVSPRLATRIVCYTDSDEVSEQRIVISSNGDTLHVFPVTSSPGSYERHALCRKPKAP
jgi:hypothetical protein